MIRSRRRLSSLALALALGIAIAASPAAAQPASLVRDINPFPVPGCPSCPPGEAGSQPGSMVTVGSRVVFVAGEPSSGRELWATDGTGLGTRMLLDATAGSDGSGFFLLGKAGGLSLWLADTENLEDGPALWRSDGTRAGTAPLLVDGEPLEAVRTFDGIGFRPHAALADGVLYLNASRWFHGPSGLWRSDGTADGTRLLFETGLPDDILEIVAGGGWAWFLSRERGLGVSDGTADGTRVLGGFDSAQQLAAARDRLFFVFDGGQGQELWTSDGTAAGTRAVTAFAPASPFLPGAALKAVGRRVYFTADDGVHGEEIWVSDGTFQGTRRLTDLAPADALGRSSGGAFDPADLAVANGRVLFVAKDGADAFGLWATAGTPASTVRLAAVAPQRPLVNLGEKVLFTSGTELWASDGTVAGTARIASLPGPAVLGPKVFSGAAFAAAGGTLWRTDGTADGTRRFTDLPFIQAFPPEASLGDRLFFAAERGAYGIELWESDGRRGGTRLVGNLATSPGSADPEDLTPVGARVIFSADAGTGRQVWGSDGTAAGTVPLIADLPPECDACRILDLVNVGTVGFALLHGPGSDRLFRTDGTPAGTALVADFGAGRLLGPAAAYQGKLFFALADHGVAELWASDGTPAGTARVAGVPGGIEALAATGPDLYLVTHLFTLEGGSATLWRTDGTPGGLREVLPLPEGASFYGSPPALIAAGGTVYFFAETADYLLELWKTDGTIGGTAAIRDVPSDISVISDPIAHGGDLYYVVHDRQFSGDFDYTALEVWRSDGTAAGTVPVAAFFDRADSFIADPQPLYLTSFAGKVYFGADARALDDGGLDPARGRELYATDGTQAGTALVRDIYPGPSSGAVARLAVVEGRLYFAAGDPVHGVELWTSDGTPGGTRLVQDIAPLGASSAPGPFVAAGGRLYFAADDGLHGRELWSLPLGGTGECQPTATRLCLGGGRFAVEADWQDFAGRRGAGQTASLTADTGAFWFFAPENLEVVVKVLDGRGLNDHFWVFYGALSNVEYSLTVTDTQTGLARRYFNPSGVLASAADTTGFGPLGAAASTATEKAPAAAAAPTLVSTRTDPAAATGLCEDTATRLCLGGRFAVEASWKDFQGRRGAGEGLSLTGDTGTFWFFDPANLEVIVKVVDGRAVNGKFWFFYGALSSVEYKLTVTDTQTGAVKTYENPSGRLASFADTGAF